MTSLFVRRMTASASASGPPVLLIHGLASRGRVDWPDADWAKPLAAAGRDVYVVDLPAHGAAPRPDAPVGTAEVIDLLAEVVEQAGGEADVIGYSLGARLAWDLAAHRTRRCAVRRAVLGGLSTIEPLIHVDLDAARAAIAGGPEPTDPLTATIVRMSRLPGLDPAAVLNVVEGMAAEPFDSRAHPPAVPVLLLGGVDDPLARGLAQLADVLPDARVQTVPGDHLTALHTPEFRAAAFAFFGV
ncbi:alpha/beta fold hydrolase [Microbacterium sp. ASV49]|uniref:Alpha/beta fold hydrolase n=1 Tax=Microbacterium candidum TaxID=3041922 RepID=A0ABT7N0K0_9MICO|nr:alpha/beta fold hydrolase [Microbacterium sp. ASV49]MDL9980229.1 alpha/beta fold hydrolase [Microbacterium sp. ASV49]